MALLTLPNELLLIASYLSFPRNIYFLTLATKHLHTLLDPYLYARDVRENHSSVLL
jgi:hypothetical protein